MLKIGKTFTIDEIIAWLWHSLIEISHIVKIIFHLKNIHSQ